MKSADSRAAPSGSSHASADADAPPLPTPDPGDTVRPGDALFTLWLLSESLHLTRTDLFKSTQEIQIIEDQKKRFADSGGVSEATVIRFSVRGG